MKLKTSDQPTEVVRSVVLDREVYSAVKVQAAQAKKGVNQAIADLLAESVGMPTRKISTSRAAEGPITESHLRKSSTKRTLEAQSA